MVLDLIPGGNEWRCLGWAGLQWFWQSCRSDSGVLGGDPLPCASRWLWGRQQAQGRGTGDQSPHPAAQHGWADGQERTAAATRAWWLRAAAPLNRPRPAPLPRQLQVSLWASWREERVWLQMVPESQGAWRASKRFLKDPSLWRGLIQLPHKGELSPEFSGTRSSTASLSVVFAKAESRPESKSHREYQRS